MNENNTDNRRSFRLLAALILLGVAALLIGAGRLGDSMMTPALEESTIALYDIDPVRLDESAQMLEAINRNNG